MRAEDIRIRDPFVFVEDGMYYLLGTTGEDCWNKGSNFSLYASRDLEHFEFAGRLVADGALDGYTQLWAPELHKFRGKYYLIVSLFRKEKRRGSMILVSDSVRVPFVPLTGEYITPQGWLCLDATLFVHDGKPYLYFSNEWVDPITADGDGSLYVAALSDDLKTLISRPKKIVSGKYCGFSREIRSGEATGFVAEGPYAVEEGGKIALYWSTFSKDGYCVAKSVASEVFGEYAFDRMVFERDGGHAMVFTDLAGKRKIVLHQPNSSPDERMKVFDLAP